ncbi:MAG: extracellular solute-binding protein, partial [Clostridia bacterium]|nr:extracellular solute-binding protein [Clostridia bacterium]
LKSYVSQDYIYDISELVKESKIVNLDDMWDSLKQRYSFDQNTFQYSENAPIWGLSKDLGVSAIYYNADAFQKAGITVISVPESEVGAESEKHGFYQKDGKAYFNNRIAMTWEELVEVSKLLTRGYNENSPTLYGYYDERPLGYLWSVGGDTVRYVESGDPAYNGGYWEWTLGDTEAHTLNGKTLPSNREAINFWTSLSTGNNEKYGLTKPVSPYPSIVSDQYSAFTDQQAAMLVLPRYAVSAFRRDCDFNWDVAPVVKHADGVQAGYTTSMCYSLSVNSNKQKYAFKFMEYMSGPEGQAELAKHGFNVPNQISVTNSDAFLKSTEPPFNNAVFAEGAVYQRVGDWTYLPDTAWSDAYEDAMNDVRNGRKTIDSLISDFESTVNTYLKRYTAKK